MREQEAGWKTQPSGIKKGKIDYYNKVNLKHSIIVSLQVQSKTNHETVVTFTYNFH